MSVARVLAAVWACGIVGVLDGQNVYESYQIYCFFTDSNCTNVRGHGLGADYIETEIVNEYGFIISRNYHSPNCLKGSVNASCQQYGELGLNTQGEKCYGDNTDVYVDLSQCIDVTTSTTTTTVTTITTTTTLTTTTGSNNTSDDFPVWAIVLLSIGVPLACVLAVMGYRKYLVKQATAATATLTNDIL